MQPIDLVTVLKDAPRGEWLALSWARDRIVAHCPNLAEGRQATLKLREKQPIMMRVPPPHALIF